MTLLQVIGILLLAGGIGGLVNAFLAAEGFIMPRKETLADGNTIVKLGFLGNVFVGSVAAFVLGGLYGPLSQAVVGNGAKVLINVGVIAGAVVSGIGGARLLTQEVDNKLAAATNKEMSKVVQNLTRKH